MEGQHAFIYERVTTFVPSLKLEKRVPPCDVHKLIVALATPISYDRQSGVPLLTILAHHTRVVERIGGQELLRVVVGVDGNLPQGVVNVHILAPLAHHMLQERRQKFQSVPDKPTWIKHLTSQIVTFLTSDWIKLEFNHFSLMVTDAK